MNSKIEQLKEYARIIKDTPYALRTYLQTYDNTQKKYVPMDLFPDQLQLIQDYEDYNENITKKYSSNYCEQKGHSGGDGE